MNLPLIYPDWPLEDKVCAFTTTRAGGCSTSPYDGFNLAIHVDDQVEDVIKNRNRLNEYFSFTSSPKWLQQTHSNIVVRADEIEPDSIEADATFATTRNEICAVLTADCLPVLLADRNGECVAAAHAGWQGLAKGIIQETIHAMSDYIKPEYAWLGPAIGPQAFEVGEDVYDTYMDSNIAYQRAFSAKKPGKWNLDIYAAAKIVLAAADIPYVYGGAYCTYQDQDRFFSYRRSEKTGRMATVIMRK